MVEAQNEEKEAKEEEKTRVWYERIEINGDLRLRYEGFQKDQEFDDGRRDRFRYRLRAGIDAEVNDFLRAGFQLRSGDPNNPVSDNQSLDGGFNKDSISVAEVFADFTASKHFEVIVGKFSRGDYWEAPDMQWDNDVVYEGAVERLEFDLRGGSTGKIEGYIYQYVLEEDDDSADAFVFGADVHPLFVLNHTNELTLGFGFDYYVNPQFVVDLTLSGKLTGNRVTNLLDDSATLVSEFRILHTLAIWQNRSIARWPVKLSFFYYKNTGASDDVGKEIGYTGAELIASENDTATFFRVETGGYDEYGRMQFRYSHYYSQPDALFYAYMQSDTGRSSNLDGHRFDWRLGMPARTFINVTYYRTNPAEGYDTTENRWQFDYIIRF
jgi:hypothetical protein